MKKWFYFRGILVIGFTLLSFTFAFAADEEFVFLFAWGGFTYPSRAVTRAKA